MLPPPAWNERCLVCEEPAVGLSNGVPVCAACAAAAQDEAALAAPTVEG